MLSFTKNNFFKASLYENKYNYRNIFGICNNLLGRNHNLPLLTCNSNKELADGFNTFFIDKIQKIRMDLNCLKDQWGLTNIQATPPEMFDLPANLAMRQFRQVSIEETTTYIMKSPSKNCELYPIPTDILKIS